MPTAPEAAPTVASSADLVALDRNPASLAGPPRPGRGFEASRTAMLLGMQQTLGNRAVQRLIQRMASSAATLRPSAEEHAPLDARIRAAGAGTPLEPAAQHRLEQSLGADLSGVRVHTDSAADTLAREVHATAFTTEADIFFRSGTYAPASSAGLRLLAHEATHTLQQAAGPVAGTPGPGGLMVSAPTDPFERAATRAAEQVALAGAAVTQPLPSATASASNQRHAVQPLTPSKLARAPSPARAAGTATPSTRIRVQTAPETAPPAGEAAAPSPASLMTKAAVAMNGGSAKYYYLAADTQGNSLFVIFDHPDVQTFYRSLLQEWFGVDGPNPALEDTPDATAPPKWVDAFRTKALNVEPHSSGEAKQQADLALQLANSVAGEPPTQRLRRQFVEEADKRIGTTVMTQAQIDAERAQPAKAGLTPKNFTTCIAFFSQVVQQVTKDSKLQGPLLDGPNAYQEINPQAKKKLPPGAWHACTPGGTDRPRPGDLLIFTFAEDVKQDGKLKYGKGWFAHITIFRSSQPLQDTEEDKQANGLAKECPGSTIEKWISVDGGGTTASETVRYFCPEKCLIAGRSDKRTLHGWIDIEVVGEAALPKDQTAEAASPEDQTA